MYTGYRDANHVRIVGLQLARNFFVFPKFVDIFPFLKKFRNISREDEFPAVVLKTQSATATNNVIVRAPIFIDIVR